jgi:hypothetical protein
MQSQTLVDTRGDLGVVAVENSILIVDGWVASFDAGAMDAFKVTCGGRELTPYEAAIGLPSEDVQRVHPTLDHAERCRFRVRVRLAPEDQAQVQRSILAFVPMFRGRAGHAMLRILEPALPLPPDEDADYIGKAFMVVSSEFLGYFIQCAGLQPTESVLDAGCGVGRMAYSLAHYLAPEGRYEGFDIVDRLIVWAQNNITPSFPNFRFQKVDVYNQWYNPSGTIQPHDFKFPYADASFDLVFLTSVFTHMRSAEVQRYLDEIYRVLKPGGRCLCTCSAMRRG